MDARKLLLGFILLAVALSVLAVVLTEEWVAALPAIALLPVAILVVRKR